MLRALDRPIATACHHNLHDCSPQKGALPHDNITVIVLMACGEAELPSAPFACRGFAFGNFLLCVCVCVCV